MARTRARSVVMSAGGQAADYYHCMNMNETRRRTSEVAEVEEERERERGRTKRTVAEKDIRMRANGERCLVAKRARTREGDCATEERAKHEREKEREELSARRRARGARRGSERRERERSGIQLVS